MTKMIFFQNLLSLSNFILKEVKSVLKHAVDRNLVRESFHAKRNCFDAWRQVVEITFAVCPSDMIPVEKKQTILMEILQQLMPKVILKLTLDKPSRDLERF